MDKIWSQFCNNCSEWLRSIAQKEKNPAAGRLREGDHLAGTAGCCLKIFSSMIMAAVARTTSVSIWA